MPFIVKMLLVNFYSFFKNMLKGYTFCEAFANSHQAELAYFSVLCNILEIPLLNIRLTIH